MFLTGAGVYPAKLEAEIDVMVFGEVYLDSTSSQNLAIVNTGGDTLRLQIDLPSEEFTVTPAEAVLPPGEGTTLEVTLSPGTHGPLSATLTMPNNGVDDTVRVALSGDGVDRLVRFDVSGNGVIDAHDLRVMTEVLNGQPPAEGIDLDYTRDGVIDEADLDVLVSWVEYQPVRRVVTDSTGIAILLETTGDVEVDTEPLHGLVRDDGALTYVTARGFDGLEVVGLIAADGQRSLFVIGAHRPPNRAPTLSAVDNQEITEGEELVIELHATDADGDQVEFGILGLDGAAVSEGVLRWMALPGTAGSYQVLVRARDAYGDETTINFNLIVSVPEPPTLEVEEPIADSIASPTDSTIAATTTAVDDTTVSVALVDSASADTATTAVGDTTVSVALVDSASANTATTAVGDTTQSAPVAASGPEALQAAGTAEVSDETVPIATTPEATESVVEDTIALVAVPANNDTASTIVPEADPLTIAPQVTLSTEALDFGEIEAGSAASLWLSVANPSDASIDLGRIALDGNAFTLVSTERVVPAHGRVWLEVAFRSQAEGVVLAYLELTDAPGSPRVELRGVGSAPAPEVILEPQIAVGVAAIELGGIEVGRTATASLTITNVGTADLEITDVAVEGSGFGLSSSTVLPLRIDPGQGQPISLAFAPILAGTARGMMHVVSNDPGQPIIEVALAGSAFISPPLAPRIALSVQELVFDLADLDATPLMVTVTNDGTAPLQIQDIVDAATQLTVDTNVFRLDRGASAQVTVVRPQGLRPGQQGVLRFHSDDPDEPVLEVLWRAPGVESTPDVVIAGLRQTDNDGARRQLALPIDNQGRETLIIDAVPEGVGEALQVERLVVEPGRTGLLRFRVAPDVPGGTLRLHTNSRAEPVIDVVWEVPFLRAEAAAPTTADDGIHVRFSRELLAESVLQAWLFPLSLEGEVTTMIQDGTVPASMVVTAVITGDEAVFEAPTAPATTYCLMLMDVRGDNGWGLEAPFMMNFTTPAKGTGGLHGTVYSKQGPVPAASVLLADAAGNLVGFSTVQPDGQFQLGGVPAGRYQILIRPDGAATASTVASVDLPREASLDLLLTAAATQAEDEALQLDARTIDLLQRPNIQPNYPNPFNPETTVQYLLPEGTFVRVAIYSMLGQRIRTLYEGYREAGWHRITWQGVDDAGRPVGAGIYLQAIEGGNFRDVRKMTLLQ